MIKNLLVALIASLLSICSYSQDFSNKGKEFWLAYSYHVGMVNTGGTPAMTLYLTSDVATTYSVEIFGVTLLANGAIPANTVIPITIPNTYFVSTDGLSNGRAIHVTSVKPIVVYSFITRSQASAATLCLPSNVLGKQYYGMSFTQASNEANARSYITIVGVEDNTNVEIIPTAPTVAGWAANTVHTISLNKGQVYQVLGTTTGNNGVDLSGTSVKSIASGTGGCKRIAVFSGSGKIAIGCPTSSSDNLYQQLYPASTWGKKYLTAPSYQRVTNYFRIMRSDPAANVTLNGVAIPAASFTNGYYQFVNSSPNLIQSNLPISVTQYFTSQGCTVPGNPTNGSPYDPDMIVLNPVEQNISNVTLVSSPLTVAGAHQHNIHVIMKNSGTAISSFKLDNSPIPATAAWVPHPQDPNYSYLYLGNIAAGNHSLSSDSGFNALAYGYGMAETYGYSAGTNVKDLYQQIAVQTQYGIEPTPSVCTGAPFKFKISLPYKPLQLAWNLASLPASTLPNNNNVTQNPIGAACTTLTGTDQSTYVCHDSTTLVNGVPIWWYSLPLTYTINGTGVYDISIIAQTGGVDGCGSEQEINFELQVSAPPVADFTFTPPGCPGQAVQFTDATVSVKPNYHWYYDFGDATPISNLQNPTHTYAAGGSYVVRFSSITTPGCLSDTIEKTIVVPAALNATISSTNNSVCQNSTTLPTVTFTGTGGAPPYTFTYHINAGAPVVVNAPAATPTTVTLTIPSTTTGSFTYFLDNIRNTGSTICTQNILGQSAVIVVNPLPTATISGSAIVCQNSAPLPPVTFTGANGTAPYTISYNINGVPQTPVVTTGNSITLNAPTDVFGSFNYTITGITDATGTACNTTYPAATGPSAIIKIEALPTATVTGGTTICVNGTAPQIVFTASGGQQPYTFTYFIETNTIAGPTLTTSSDPGLDTKTFTPSSAIAGTYRYVLTNVKSADGTVCSTPYAPGLSATLQVNPLPTAAISGTTTVCQNIPAAQSISFTGSAGTAPYTFTYTIDNGSGPGAPITTPPSTGNVYTLPVSTATPGTFIYTLISVADASATACSNTVGGSATVTVTARPTATITGTQELCLNVPSGGISFTGAGGTPAYTFTYNLNGNPNQTISTTAPSSTINLPVATTTAGIFTYNLVSVTDVNGCVSLQPVSTATITVNPKPSVGFTTVAPFCESKAVTFTPSGTVSSGAIVSWIWDYGDGTGSHILTTSAPFDVIYTTTGIKIVTLKTVSDKGCESDVYAQTFTVNARPEAGFILPEVCLLDPFAQFTDTSKPVGGISTWQWNFGDPNATPGNPNTSTVQNATHTYSAVGPYPVQLIVTSTFGCKDTITQTLVINSGNPVSDFTVQNSTALCSGTDVSIQNKSTITSGNITKLEIFWNNIGAPAVFDTDDDPLFDEVYTHAYPLVTTDQNYTIRVRAYSGGVCFSDKTQVITVRGKPTVQFSAIPDVCLNNGTVQLTQASETLNGATTSTGTYSGTGVSSSGLFTPITAGPGTFILTYTFTSAFGCTDTKTQTIKVLQAPVAVFSAGTSCVQTAVTFTQASTSTEGAITQWVWNFEGTDEIHTDGNPVTHVFNTPGIKTVTLTVITAGGCRSLVNSQNITVNPQPAPNFTFTASACLPEATIVFTNTTPNLSDNSYLWSFDFPSTAPGSTSTALSPSHVYTSVGPHPVRLVATNTTTGCSAFRDQSVNTIHPSPLASFDFDKASICTGQSVNVIDNSTGADGSISTWSWYYGDNTPTVSGQVPGPHTYTTAATFDVKLSIQNNFGCTDDTSRKFTVYAFPTLDAGEDVFVLEGGSAVLQPKVTAIEPQFLWTSNTSSTYLDDVTAENPVSRPLTDVIYTLTVTGKGGCTVSDQVAVTILKFPQIPNTFTPNGDGIHDKWDIGYLYTYPNNRVQVFSRTGQLVFESKGYTKPWDGTIKGKELPVDTYYYIIEPGYGRKPITGYVTIMK